MQKTTILGILVYDRIKEAGRTQQVLSKYASVISTRLGFHELSENVCSRVGTILLVLQGTPEERNDLYVELLDIGGVEVQKMQFNY